MPLSPAEKQQRYRDRLKAREGNAGTPPGPPDGNEGESQEPAGVTGFERHAVVPVVMVGEELLEFEGKLLPVVRKCSWSEEQYVAHELAITREHLRRGMKNPIVRGEDAMARSERYLRRRYRGFRTGQIATL